MGYGNADVRRRADGLSEFAGQPNRPVIIGACPRSGTTLLRTMLHSHPELAMPRETRFVLESWERRRRFGDLRELENRRRLAHWIFKRRKSRWRILGVKRKAAIERLLEAPPTLGSMLASCFVLFAEKHGKPRWGDKRPLYAAQMQAIWDLFPNAQFINVIRDPRGCATSMRRLGWYEGEVAPAIEIWERSIKTVQRWQRRLAPDQLIDVRYENLIADPPGTLKEIAEFLGLASDPTAIEEMLRYHEREERRSSRYHANVARPPDPARVSQWRDALDESEIAFIEEAAGKLMQQLGYEPVADGVSPPAELLRAFREQRREIAAARRKVVLRDRLWKLVTYRQPLAAETTSARSPGAG